jgi:hypothetical protein
MKIKMTEKTMIEMRAQFLSLHKPIAVATPQIAGSKYTREAAAINALNIAGDPGNCEVWPFGTKTVTASMRSPKASVRSELSRDRIEITVTPVERVIIGVPLFRLRFTCDQRPLALYCEMSTNSSDLDNILKL